MMQERTRIPTFDDFSDDEMCTSVSGSASSSTRRHNKLHFTPRAKNRYAAVSPLFPAALDENSAKVEEVQYHSGQKIEAGRTGRPMLGDIAFVGPSKSTLDDDALSGPSVEPKMLRLSLLGFCLAVTPHVFYSISKCLNVQLDEWALQTPKIVAPYLIFTGLALHYSPHGVERPPPSSVYIFSFGIIVMTLVALVSWRTRLEVGNVTLNGTMTQISFTASELVAMCDSVASKAILSTNAVLLTLGHVSAWVSHSLPAQTVMQIPTFALRFAELSCLYTSSFCTGGLREHCISGPTLGDRMYCLLNHPVKW